MNDISSHSSTEKSLRAKAKSLGMPFVDLTEKAVEPAAFEALQIEDALRLTIAPLLDAEGHICVALCEPGNVSLENKICHIIGDDVDLVVASKNAIQTYLRRADGSGQVLRNVAKDFQSDRIANDAFSDNEIVDLRSVVGETGVVRLLNSILMAAMEKTVSDIHIERSEHQIDLKYRIDGILQPAADQLDAAHHEELISRIKVLAELDVAEQRIPQDGRFRMRYEERDIDFRVSVLPTQFGEDVVIRILDKAHLAQEKGLLSLEGLGISHADLRVLRQEARAPYGLMLITGPTGSGKTTTLYGALGEMNDGAQKIVTIEDPIEYQIENVSQIPVNEKKGLTFAAGLRSILRHDPDKIMVGEIRDRETAEIAIQAALTGHLVLASVHANNTLDVIGRFTHWGIDLHDFVTALNAVFAQRLFRQLCPQCKTPTSGTPRSTQRFDANGCLNCSGTGFRGRIAAIEYLRIDEEIAELIVQRSVFGKLKKTRQKRGFRDLEAAALELVETGQTSIDEYKRVLGLDHVE